MRQSSAGGAAAAGGVGHEGRCLAWAAAYMLAEAPLPTWASGRRVVAVGGQTGRPVDDVGLVTDDEGWVTIQAKKGLQIGRAKGSALGEALRQLVEIHAEGVPDRPPWTERLRGMDPDRDLVLVLTDQSAVATVDRYLVPVTDRLRDLPDAVPLADTVTNKEEERALRVLREHLARYWPGPLELTDLDFRRLARVLSVRTMHLTDGGNEEVAGQLLLGEVANGPGEARRIWEALQIEAQRLAEQRSFLHRNGLIRRLEMRQIWLRPVARLRPDIQRLRERTQLTMQVQAAALTIAAPEKAVALSREIEPAITGADGNLAITGAPGTGKTVLLHSLAAGQADAGTDIVVLNSENLGATAGQTWDELGIVHDLGDVLAGWTGSGPGLLLIDGLDQGWGSDAPAWLPDLARALEQTRWRICATIRTFDLKHGRRWRAMFAGEPVAGHADPELAGVRHLVVGDLTEQELTQVRRASPRLAGLLDQADARLRALLANPFNLDLAGQLLADSGADLLGVSSRLDLLDRYWDSRVTCGTGALDRMRTARELVRLMLAAGRQTVSPLSLPTAAVPTALEALQHEGVLRDLPRRPGTPIQPVTFAHPVLFDYAVAVLALGDPDEPGSLVGMLDEDPNLAITVRPSLGYRLAIDWAADATRRAFWHLALRLASRTHGHPLAAVAAAQVAADSIAAFPDLEELANACTGASSDPDRRWGPQEASELAFLAAAAAARLPEPGAALDALGGLAQSIAAHARSADDINLALLAAQLPVRAVGARSTALHARAADKWTAAAVDCMHVALSDLDDQRRVPVARLGGQFLAAVAPHDAHATADVIRAAIAPAALTAWNVTAIMPLIGQVPEIAATAPALAVEIAAAVWEYEESQDTQDTPTPLIDSAILALTSNRRQDLESARYSVADKFPALLAADPSAATELLLRIAELPRMYRWGHPALAGEQPQLRTGDGFALSGGDRDAAGMADAFVQELGRLAEADPPVAGNAGQGTAGDIIAVLVARLHNSGVWQRLLNYAAEIASPALCRALLPALTSVSLYAHPATWIGAGHVVARLSPALDDESHRSIENAILRVPGTRIGTTYQAEMRELLRNRTRTLLAALDPGKLGTRAQQVLAAGQGCATEPLPDLQDASDVEVSDAPVPPAGSSEELASRVRAAVRESGDQDPEVRAAGLTKLTALWEELKGTGAHNRPGATQEQLASLRLEAAERLATAPAAAPATELGAEVFAELRAELPAATTAGSLWHSAGAWTSAPAASALQGMVHLLGRKDWRDAHGTEISALLTPLLDSQDPVHRYIASHALPALHPAPDNLIDEIAPRLRSEADHRNAAFLMSLLARFAPSRPARADQLLEQLAALPQWTILTAPPDGDQQCGPADSNAVAVDLMTILAARYDTPYARTAVTAWLSKPLSSPHRATRAMISLRGLLNPAQPAGYPAQDRAFGLLAPTLDQLRATFTKAATASVITDDLREQVTSTIKIANEVARHLYSASGASDRETSSQPTTQADGLTRFCALALPLLDALSSIHHPAVTHHIVETIDRIGEVQPKRAFLIAVNAVTHDPAYPREVLAVDAAIRLIRHYTADQPGRLISDPESATAVRTLLEAFIRLGWDQAITLAEELDELFV